MDNLVSSVRIYESVKMKWVTRRKESGPKAMAMNVR